MRKVVGREGSRWRRYRVVYYEVIQFAEARGNLFKDGRNGVVVTDPCRLMEAV